MAESTSSKCNVCGSKRTGSDILICDSCAENYCDDCSVQCDVGDPDSREPHNTCKDCHISSPCTVCGRSFCEYHRSQGQCEDCNGYTCYAHPIFYCEICLDTTASCCGTFCDLCGKGVNKGCYSTCSECVWVKCNNCGRKCPECKEENLCLCLFHNCLFYYNKIAHL